MKRILLYAALVGPVAQSFAAPVQSSDVQWPKPSSDSRTHECGCGFVQSGATVKVKNSELIDCNDACRKEGGWSQKAILSNTHDFRGITCICNATQSIQVSQNEGVTEPITKRIHCLKTENTPVWTKSKCWASGWKGFVKVTQSNEIVQVQPGQEMCSVRTKTSMKIPGDDFCDKATE